MKRLPDHVFIDEGQVFMACVDEFLKLLLKLRLNFDSHPLQYGGRLYHNPRVYLPDQM